ncbi:MAG: DNAJ heat shock family protein [Monoraphidium minutum]|nr:MAG: DNAJ heat shock family protein [Monoraphidium minutum]
MAALALRAAALLCLLALLPAALARNFYDILSVPKNANEQQIKRSYRKLALQFHPDKVSGTEEQKAEAAKRFADINHAYETLSDQEKREIYDRYGEEGLRQHAGQQGGGRGGPGGNIFDFFFGGGGPFGGGGEEEEQTPKGDSVVVDLYVSLEDLYNGRDIPATRDKAVFVPGPGKRKCRCRQKLMTRQLGPGMIQQFTQQVCDECPGVKLERSREPINVAVEPGMTDGHEIVFFEEGEPEVDGEPGDLKFRLRTLPHATFTRAGPDLLMNATISLLDALVGFSRTLPHLDGHAITLASAGVTRPGDVQRVAGEGMPLFQHPDRKGDLFVTYTVDFPAALSEEQKAAARTLLGGGGGAAAAA